MRLQGISTGAYFVHSSVTFFPVLIGRQNSMCTHKQWTVEMFWRTGSTWWRGNHVGVPLEQPTWECQARLPPRRACPPSFVLISESWAESPELMHSHTQQLDFSEDQRALFLITLFRIGWRQTFFKKTVIVNTRIHLRVWFNVLYKQCSK